MSAEDLALKRLRSINRRKAFCEQLIWGCNYVPKTYKRGTCIPLGGPCAITNPSKLEEEVKPLAIEALKKYNERFAKEYEVEEVVKANLQSVEYDIYYITFQAKGGEQGLVTFQAVVYQIFDDEDGPDQFWYCAPKVDREDVDMDSPDFDGYFAPPRRYDIIDE